MFLFQLVSVSLISIAFYTYLANIVFSCDLAFNVKQQLSTVVLNSKYMDEFLSSLLQKSGNISLESGHWSPCILCPNATAELSH